MIPRQKQPILGEALILVQVILCLRILIQMRHYQKKEKKN